MNEIEGTYRNGHVELTAPVNWPDGTPVTVQPQQYDDDPAGTRLPSVQLSDGRVVSWSDTPEFRRALLEQMDRREPVELTPQEEAEWRAAKTWIKEHTIAAVRREMGLDP